MRSKMISPRFLRERPGLRMRIIVKRELVLLGCARRFALVRDESCAAEHLPLHNYWYSHQRKSLTLRG
jgi:hypothetical protein